MISIPTKKAVSLKWDTAEHLLIITFTQKCNLAYRLGRFPVGPFLE